MESFNTECEILINLFDHIKEEDRGKYIELDNLEGINNGIYESQSKTDLYRVFGAKKLIEINEIYDELIQLSESKPSEHLLKHNKLLKEHEEAKAGQPHLFLCKWHLDLIISTNKGLKLSCRVALNINNKISKIVNSEY